MSALAKNWRGLVSCWPLADIAHGLTYVCCALNSGHASGARAEPNPSRDTQGSAKQRGLDAVTPSASEPSETPSFLS
jgi:hypothetical protein